MLTSKLETTPEQLIRKATPALLPGFHAYIHSETLQPCLLQSASNDNYVQGIVLFGQGRESRDLIHRHYRPYARRVKVQVEIDVSIPVPISERRFADENWTLERRRIWAHSWLWSDAANAGEYLRMDLPGWRLEDYLAGNYEQDEHLRIGRDGSLGKDYDGEVSGDESDDGVSVHAETEVKEDEEEGSGKREVVYGGCGSVEYERDEAAIGWW